MCTVDNARSYRSPRSTVQVSLVAVSPYRALSMSHRIKTATVARPTPQPTREIVKEIPSIRKTYSRLLERHQCTVSYRFDAVFIADNCALCSNSIDIVVLILGGLGTRFR